jgi:hypothetical protein
VFVLFNYDDSKNYYPLRDLALMKALPQLNMSSVLRAALVIGVCGGAVSCSLPPRQAWQRMKDEGVLKAFFVPKRSLSPGDTTDRLAGADLSVDPEAVGRRAADTPPVAELAGRSGYVYSPRTTARKLVNVKDFAAGETVLCPYTMEPFVVPVGAGGPARMAATSFGPPEPGQAESMATGASGNTQPAVEEVASRELTTPLLPQEPPMIESPTGTWVEGKPGHVYSPYAARHQLVDVTGVLPGAEVHCPFSGRIFRVPELGVVADPLLGGSVVAEVPPAETAEVAATIPGTAEDQVVAGPDDEALRELATLVSEAPPSKYGASTPLAAPPAPPTLPSSVKPDPVEPAAPVPAPEPALPTAAWAPNKPGLVQSPYGQPGELVDVTGKPGGSKVICPFSNKPFLVPAP